MYYQPSEIVNLLVALFLTPVMWLGLRDLEIPGKPFFVGGYAATVLAFTAAIVEQAPPFPLFAVFNTLEHLSLGAAGVLFAMGAWKVYVHRRGGEGL
jgi:hypothetical protein